MRILQRIPYIGSLILLAYMPLHIFLSQSLSMVTGGLDVWKVAKDAVLFLLCLFTVCLVFWQGRATRLFRGLVIFTVIYAAIHVIVWMIHPDIYARSAILGLVYNLRLPLALVLGAGTVLLLPKFVFSSLTKVVIGVGTLVALLGIIQFFLPGDLLTHLGYGLERGVRAAFYIDDNRELPLRIISTLREPNALGAYLLLPTALLGARFLRARDSSQRYLLLGLIGLHGLAIGLTFSRSAWLAAVLIAALLVWWQHRGHIKAWLRRCWLVAAAVGLLGAASLFAMRNTTLFQQYIIHSNPSEQVTDLDSNDYHRLFIERGLQGIAEKPLGHGPGTAGLASIQNPEGSFLTENYYIQIGYEIGVIGLALFLALHVWIYLQLRRRQPDDLTRALLATFWGYMLINMLLHIWSNEAVATQWWLLVGAAITAAAMRPQGKSPQ